MRPLVLLRPLPGAERSAERARAMGLDVRHAPLFAVVPLDWAVPDPAEYDALLLTSANAVHHAGPGLAALRGLPVHAVGEATAATARKAGLTVASTGEGGVAGLDLPRGGRLLHLCGRDHKAVPGASAVPVYAALACDRPAGLEPLGGCVVAVHSPRAGQRLAELVDGRSATAIAAISPAAAEACESGWEEVRAASHPTDLALLALAAELCDSPSR